MNTHQTPNNGLSPILFLSVPLLHSIFLSAFFLDCGSSVVPSLLRSVVYTKGTKRGKMNCFYGYQQMNTVTSCEEMRMESVVCPKPRRLGLSNNSSMNNNHIRPLRCPISYQSEMDDSGVGAELLDIILSKEPERSGDKVMASSPPFFCGSPPSRASNPVIQDEQFGNGNFSPFTVASSSPSSSARGCVPMKFGNTPAAVRIEGFDCLSRDRSNRSISAVA